MFSPNRVLFFLALVYALGLFSTPIFFFDRKISFPKNKLLLIFILAFLLRLIPAFFFPFGSGHDVKAFLWAGETVVQKENLYYSVDVKHNFAFFPSYALLTSLFIKLSQKTGLPALPLMKLPIVFFDAAIAAIIFIIGKNLKNALIYAVSPIGIIISSYLGQFDSATLSLSLLALYAASLNKNFLAMITLGLATSFKPWSILFLPLLLLRQKKFWSILFLSVSFSLPLVLITLFYKWLVPLGNIIFMIGAIITYDSVTGWWGLSLIFRKLTELLKIEEILNFPFYLTKSVSVNLAFQIPKVIVVSLILSLFLFFKKIDLFNLAKWAILIIYIFSFSFGSHYLLWIFPFALLTKDSFVKYYLILVGGYFLLFGVLGGLDYNFYPPSLPQFINELYIFLLWIFFLLWGIKELKPCFSKIHEKSSFV